VTDGLEKLTATQQSLLTEWLPGAVVVKDHSWGLVQTTVLEVTHDGGRLIVKAGGPEDHHIAREIHAHLSWLGPWTSLGRAPILKHFDAEARILVTGYLPGELVSASERGIDALTFRQAGELLAMLHAQTAVVGRDYEAQQNRRSLSWLGQDHLIDEPTERRLREEIASWPTPESVLVPTHGDWQPRNWLLHDGVVSVIDFGRAELRPAMSDFTRVAAQDFARDAALEVAFLDGYGADPRDQPAWYRTRVRDAIGTTVWAHQVGDTAFEAQGHRMIAEVLADSPGAR